MYSIYDTKMPKMSLFVRAIHSMCLFNEAAPHGHRMSHQLVHCQVHNSSTVAPSQKHRCNIIRHQMNSTLVAVTTIRRARSIKTVADQWKALSTNNTIHRSACTARSQLPKHLPLKLRCLPTVCLGESLAIIDFLFSFAQQKKKNMNLIDFTTFAGSTSRKTKKCTIRPDQKCWKLSKNQKLIHTNQVWHFGFPTLFPHEFFLFVPVDAKVICCSLWSFVYKNTFTY